jgi:plasmid replication initiation protein
MIAKASRNVWNGGRARENCIRPTGVAGGQGRGGVMASRAHSIPQLDLFVHALSNIQLRDQREVMERPFFSLSKRKRLTPINYVSPDGSVTVVVEPHQKFGMPTIWDADLLIWAASTLNDMKKRGVNDIPRSLTARPYELLKAIGRDVGGSDFRQIHDAALRLRNVSITTNIRSKTGEKPENFSWLDKVSVTKRARESDGEKQYASFTLTVSDWFYQAVLEEGALLSIDPAYFAITGGRERWLYRVVRKHAGGAGPNGVTMKLQTLFEKSGAEGTYRRFKFELLKIIQKNDLPGFDLFLEIGTFPEPSMRMVPKNPHPAPEADDKPPMAVPSAFPQLSDTTLSLVRSKCPGLDVYAIKSDFDAYLAGRAPPDDYQKAFYGFARQRYQRLAI